MDLTGKNFIGSEWSGEGSTFSARNPANGQSLEPPFFEATAKEIDRAIQNAGVAFPLYRNKTGVEKAKFLEAIADEILATGGGLIARCMEETGLPEARLTGERMRTVNQLKLFAGVVREGSWVDARIDRADADRKPLPRPDIRSMFRPLGPVGIFGASNFPFAFSVAGGDTVSALAAGCTVVVKAHPAHPGTCELVAHAIIRAAKRTGMPEGVFSMMHGPSVDVGLSIVRHPLIQAIGFTGSYRGGKAIFDEANKRAVPIPVYAEMGSTNPVFILPRMLEKHADLVARDLAGSVTLGVGQFCTNPGLVMIEESAAASTFRKELSRLFGESPPGVMLTESIRDNFNRGLERLRSAGASVATGEKAGSDGFRGSACLLEAKVRSFLADHSLEEEVFGPSTLLLTADSRDEIMAAAENLSGHLTATIHGTDEDLDEFRDLVAVLERKVGRLIINGYPTGVEVCHSMVHGGPFPATTDSRTTSVGTRAISRFARPVCYQNFPQRLLPDELKDENPLRITRMVDGVMRNP